MKMYSQNHNLKYMHFYEKLCSKMFYISLRSTTFMLKVYFESSCIMVKNWLKVVKNMKFSTLRKISKFGNFDFSKWNLDFLISWWTSFIFWHVLMNCDLWHLILTKKSKFDFSVCSWLLISWLKINYQLIDIEGSFESCH